MNSLSRRILIVDDNLSIHDDFRKILCPGQGDDAGLGAAAAALFGDSRAPEAGPSYELDYAAQGQEALTMVCRAWNEDRPYMMAFIDVRMPPGWDGIETTSRIWEVDSYLQVVICTAYSDYSWKQLAAKLSQPDRFVILKKPFDTMEVLQMANAFTEKWHLLKQMEERARKLRESEKRYHFLADAVPGIVWTAKPDGKIDYANRRLQVFSGRTLDQNKDWGWQDILHPDDAAKAVELWTGCLRSGGDYEVEYRLKRASDGSYRWHLGRAIPMRNGNGEIERWIGSATDIDDQKRAEEALRQAQNDLESRIQKRTAESAAARARLQSVLDGATRASIIATDLSGVITIFNSGAETFFGYTAAEVIGKQTPALFHLESEIAAYSRELTQQLGRNITGFDALVELARQGKFEEREWTCVRKDGSHLKVAIVVTNLRGEQGELTGFLGVARDITENKLAEEKLRLQTSALEAAGDGIVITDRTARILWVNPAFTRLTGYGAEEAVGGTPAVLKSGVHDRSFYEGMWKTILGGKVWRGELVNRRKDGSHYNEGLTITPVLDQSGEIQHFVAINQDITKRKQFEQELCAQRESFRALTDNAPDSIARIDRDLRFVYVNRVLERILGIPASEILGKTKQELGIPAHEEWNQAIRRVFETGETVTFEFQTESPAGCLFLEARMVPEHSTHGGVLYVLAVTRDVTERKREELERREMESRYQTLFESAGDAIMTLDAGGFLDCNTATLKVFACADKKEFVSLHPSDVSPPTQPDGVDSRTAADRHIAEAFDRGTSRFEWVHRRRNGEDFPAEVLLTAFSTGKQRVLQATVRDLTEAKRTDKERQLMELQLRQAQKLESIGQLAAGIAHEINTPTQYVGDNTRFLKDSFESIANVLRGYAELLPAAKTGPVAPEQIARLEELLAASDLDYLFEQIPAAIKETLEGVERVTRIVRAMKEFSHPGSKEKAASDLNKAIETTVTVARNEWKYVADLELDLDPALPLVPCFVGEFNQCILNLVVNAAHTIGDVVKNNPGTKGKITIRTRRDGDAVEVRVSDTGTGIPEPARARIFEPFFTTKDVGKGTGQGLTIVYGSIVKKHGGTVSFETEVGKGTTFILRLPITPRTAEAGPDKVHTPGPAESVSAEIKGTGL